MAAVLNRTLLFHQAPAFNQHKIDRRIFFDHLHTRRCYGRKSVITVAEYYRKYNASVVIDQIRLLTAPPQSRAEELLLPWPENDSELAGKKVSAGALRSRKGGDPMLLRSIISEIDRDKLNVKIKDGLKVEYIQRMGKHHKSLSKDEFLAEYAGLTSKVLFIWEGYTSVSRFDHKDYPFLNTAHLPFKRLPGCPNHLEVQPHPAIKGAADTFLATHPALQLGYIGVHMRRGDFARAHAASYKSIAQIAKFVKEVLIATKLHTLFLCTNGSPNEVEEFSAAFHSEKEVSPSHAQVITLGMKNSTWIKYLRGQNMNISRSVVINVEKMIAMQSIVFLEEKFSTFSRDIARLRLGFNKTNCFDQLLCGNCV